MYPLVYSMVLSSCLERRAESRRLVDVQYVCKVSFLARLLGTPCLKDVGRVYPFCSRSSARSLTAF